MSELLNGFNNGRGTTEGVGGQKPIDQIANGVITGAEQCNLPDVSQQRELLKAFLKWKLEHPYSSFETQNLK